MQVDEELRKREEKLEDLLKKEAHISFKDKVKSIASNIKSNAGLALPFGIALAGAGLVAYLGYRCYQQHQLIEPLIDANQFLGELKSTFEAANECKISFAPQGNILEPLRVAAEQVAQNYNVEKTQELVQLLSNNKEVSQSLVKTLNEKTQSIIGSRDGFGLGTVFGGILDVFAWLASFAIWSESGFMWEDHNLYDKKRLKR